MDSHLDSLTEIYEAALRRIDQFKDSEPPLDESQLTNLRDLRGDEDVYVGEAPPRAAITYRRGLVVARVALLAVAETEIGELTDSQIRAIRAVARFVTGPLDELRHEIEGETDADLARESGLVARDHLRDLKSELDDASVFPPELDEYRSVVTPVS